MPCKIYTHLSGLDRHMTAEVWCTLTATFCKISLHQSSLEQFPLLFNAIQFISIFYLGAFYVPVQC